MNEATTAARMRAEGTGANMSLERILVVDDETVFLSAIKKVLEGPDIKVDTAETREDAEKLLEEHDYNAVVIDVRLTGSDGEEGFEIARFVKKERPGTRVILMTAYGNPEMKDKIDRLGIDCYLEKPVPIEVIRDALNGAGREVRK